MSLTHTYHLTGGEVSLIAGLFSSVDSGPYAVRSTTLGSVGASFDTHLTIYGAKIVILDADLDPDRVLGASIFFIGVDTGQDSWTAAEIVSVDHAVDDDGKRWTVVGYDNSGFSTAPTIATHALIALNSGFEQARVPCFPFPMSTSSDPTSNSEPPGGELQRSWIANVILVKRPMVLTDFGFSVTMPEVVADQAAHQRDAFFFVMEAPNAFTALKAIQSTAEAEADVDIDWEDWDPGKLDPIDVFGSVTAKGVQRKPKLLWGSRVRVSERIRRVGGVPHDDSSHIGNDHYEGWMACADTNFPLHFVDRTFAGITDGEGAGQGYGVFETTQATAINLRSPLANVTVKPPQGCAVAGTLEEATVLIVGVMGFFTSAARLGGSHAAPDLTFRAVGDDATEEQGSLEVAVTPFIAQPTGDSFVISNGIMMPRRYTHLVTRVTDVEDYWTEAPLGVSPYDGDLVSSSWWSQREAMFAHVGSLGGRAKNMYWSVSPADFPYHPWTTSGADFGKGDRASAVGDGDWSKQWFKVREEDAWSYSAVGEDIIPLGSEIRNLTEAETEYLLERFFARNVTLLDRDVEGEESLSGSRGCWASDLSWSRRKVSMERGSGLTPAGTPVEADFPPDSVFNATSGSLKMAVSQDMTLEIPYRGSFVHRSTPGITTAEAAGIVSSRRNDGVVASTVFACCDCDGVRVVEQVNQGMLLTSLSWNDAESDGDGNMETFVYDDRCFMMGGGDRPSITFNTGGIPSEDQEHYASDADIPVLSIPVEVVSYEVDTEAEVARLDIELVGYGPDKWIGGSPIHELSGATLEYTYRDATGDSIEWSTRSFDLPASSSQFAGARRTGAFPPLSPALPLWQVDRSVNLIDDRTFSRMGRKSWGVIGYSADEQWALHAGEHSLDRMVRRIAALAARDVDDELTPELDFDDRSDISGFLSVLERDVTSSAGDSVAIVLGYNRSKPHVRRVIIEITEEGTPDVFKISLDDGETWTEDVNVASSVVITDSSTYSFTIEFGATTGFDEGDTWTFVMYNRAADRVREPESYLRVERDGPGRFALVSQSFFVSEPETGTDTYAVSLRARCSLGNDLDMVTYVVWDTGDVVKISSGASFNVGTTWETITDSFATSAIPAGATSFKIVLDCVTAEEAHYVVAFDDLDVFIDASDNRRRSITKVGSQSFFRNGLVSSREFTSAGVDDDLVIYSDLDVDEEVSFSVRVSAEDTPDEFDWTDDGGLTWTEGVSMDVDWVELSNGVTVRWKSDTDHTVEDTWNFTVIPGTRSVASVFVAVPAFFDESELDSATSVRVYRKWLGMPGRSGSTLPTGQGSRVGVKTRVKELAKGSD